MFFDEKLTELAAMTTISTTMAQARGSSGAAVSTKKQISPIVSRTVWTRPNWTIEEIQKIFDAVVEAELGLQRVHPNRVGPRISSCQSK
jgi:hypothetical protein